MNSDTLDLLDQELGKRWFQRRSPILNAAFRAQYQRGVPKPLMRAPSLWIALPGYQILDASSFGIFGL
jgi:hypothetical protein